MTENRVKGIFCPMIFFWQIWDCPHFLFLLDNVVFKEKLKSNLTTFTEVKECQLREKNEDGDFCESESSTCTIAYYN